MALISSSLSRNWTSGSFSPAGGGINAAMTSSVYCAMYCATLASTSTCICIWASCGAICPVACICCICWACCIISACATPRALNAICSHKCACNSAKIAGVAAGVGVFINIRCAAICASWSCVGNACNVSWIIDLAFSMAGSVGCGGVGVGKTPSMFGTPMAS